GNKDVDEFIRNSQLKALNDYNVLEWIPYDKFKEIEYLDEGGFSKVYKAIWTGGRVLEWNDQIQQWKRKGDMKVALKILNNSCTNFDKFLQECDIRRPKIKPEIPDLFKQLIIRCWNPEPAKRPNADELFTKFYNWWKDKDNKNSELYKQIQRSKKFSKKNPSQKIYSETRYTKSCRVNVPTTTYTGHLLNAFNYTNQWLNNLIFPKPHSSDLNIRSSTSKNIRNQCKYITIILKIT
ncbi:1577_t:CDS:2, partial [Scutellospora calospora]